MHIYNSFTVFVLMGNYKEHWALGFLIAFITVSILHFVFFISVTIDILFWCIASIFIFSILPDIDHKHSKASFFLHFSLIIMAADIFFKIFPLNFSSILIIIWIVGLELYHWKYATNDWKHRQFPHTFTFGLLNSLIFFIITRSWIAFLVAVLTFCSHILLDYGNNIEEVIKRDKAFWNILK
ncbi:MAG: hypothetical protein DRN66_03785 [Candidatus Nanohalarchaeota archaeon]|nr:MAG: hypothetical protein DRN66_03785 [Candidatus Nanohaloarchaeota archaeon]